MDPTGVIAIITVSLTGLSALIATIFQYSSLSRCTEIDCCCIHCLREVMDKEDIQEMSDIINPEKK